MKVGDLVRFKSNRADYKEFHGHVGLVVSTEESRHVMPFAALNPTVRWLEPVLFHNRLSTVSHFAANRYEVIQ